MAKNLQSHSFTRKKRAKFWWTLALVIIIMISWFCALSFLTRLDAFAIADIKVFGADPDIAPALLSAANQAISGYYWGIFSRSSTLIYPKKDIMAAIESASPRVLDVAVSRAGPRGLIVSVSEKAPAAIVCASLPDFDGDAIAFDQTGGCYLADSSGLIFEDAPSLSTSSAPANNVYYAPDLPDDPIGSYATSTGEFAALQAFYDGARAIGMAPDAVLIKDGGEYELYASTTVVYFNDARPMSDESANLAVFWARMVSSVQTEPAVFDYIDLRYGSNIFYKTIK